MRVVQPVGTKGSLKWIQRAVENRPDLLCPSRWPEIDWRSPLQSDDFAEYRDGAFLELLGLEGLKPSLADFWPRGGPQWDALGVSREGPVLVEAKAHVREFFSPTTQGSDDSREKIKAALNAAKVGFGVDVGQDWLSHFYQYTNRLAHLWWFHEQGIQARLLFVSFVGDDEAGINGPQHEETWRAVFDCANHVLGLPARHQLARYIGHVHPNVTELA